MRAANALLKSGDALPAERKEALMQVRVQLPQSCSADKLSAHNTWRRKFA